MTKYYKLRSGVYQHDGRLYKKGDIIETEINLAKMHNQVPHSIKFEEMKEDQLPVSYVKDCDKPVVATEAAGSSSQESSTETETATKYTEEELLEFSVKDLTTIAEDLEIDISGVSNSPRYRKIGLVAAILKD